MIDFTASELKRYGATLASTSPEQEYLSRMLALLAEHQLAAFSRHTFAPGHFTASAFILSPDKQRLLLIHHGKLGRWLQPGGHIEARDLNPWSAALREVKEEVGLDSSQLTADVEVFDIDVHAIPALGKEPEHEHFDLRFLFTTLSDEVVAGDEVNDAKWWSLGELASSAEDGSVRRAVQKLAQ
ncbi:MAG: NUDIX hydrolase [Myxococcota bacterium]